MNLFDLKTLGWNDFFEHHFIPHAANGLEAGRVLVEHRNKYRLYSRAGELTAEITGRLLHTADSRSCLPKVGDWVVFMRFEEERKGIIHQVLPRRSSFSRKIAGKQVKEQIIATNIDTIFIVQSLDKNYNLRRLERAFVLVNQSGAEPVVVLNKTDLCEDVSDKIKAVEHLGVHKVLTTSAKTGTGIENLHNFIQPGFTYAFIGSSGVGKSTLINLLVGENIQPTREVRKGDSKGRHTTTHRELIVLPHGGCLIDTPGMRELQLWHVEEGLSQTFTDIEEMAENCHFSNCTHTQETKCAVLAALESGDLTPKRYDNFMKMQKELTFLQTKNSKESFLEKKRKEKELHKLIKKVTKKSRRT